MKQETLEEVAEKYVDNFEYGIAHPRKVCKNAFLNGAKWQQETIYNQIKELYDNENITGFSKLAFAKCLDIVDQFKNK